MVLEATVVDEDFIKRMDLLRQVPEGEEIDLIELCSRSIVIFAEKMLGFKLYSWQVYALHKIQLAMEGDYWTKEFDYMTSRQIGKTSGLSVLFVWATIFNKYPGTLMNNTSVGLSSATDDQAKTFLNTIKSLLYMGDAYMRTTYVDADGKPIFGDEFFTGLLAEKGGNNSQMVTFKPHNPGVHGDYLLAGSKGGSFIASYPPTSVVLGKTFSIIGIDEAGKTDKITDTFYYEYVSPTGDSTDAIRINISTPWVPSGFFYRNMDPLDEHPTHATERLVFTCDAIAIENPRQYEVIQKKIAILNEDGKTDEVQRAYYCRFVKGEQSYFNPDHVRASFDPSLSMVESYGKECDVGVDFGGQVKSHTVVTVSHLNDEGFVERLYHRRYEVQKDLGLIDDLAELQKSFNVQRLIVDDCPAGDFLIRKMEEKGWNIVRMNFRSEKVKKYGAFRSFLNKGKIKSYVDKDLMTEMLSLENSNTSRQSVIVAPPGYNDDLIDSFVMSTYFYIIDDDVKIKSYSWKDVRQRVRGRFR